MPADPTPRPLANALDRALAALAAREEIKALPVGAGSSKAPGASSDSAGGASDEAKTPPRDSLAGTPSPTPGATENLPSSLRALGKRLIETAFASVIAPGMEGPARAWLTAQGAELALNDAGEPIVRSKAGDERPVTREALMEVLGGDVFMRSLGKSGSGLNDTGGTFRYVIDPLDYLSSQQAFEEHKAEVLAALARRKTGR